MAKMPLTDRTPELVLSLKQALIIAEIQREPMIVHLLSMALLAAGKTDAKEKDT